MVFFKMVEPYDREKVIDSMFDPITSAILAELEDGSKDCSFLATTFSISENEVKERLSYLLEHSFVNEKNENGQSIFSANKEKLNEIVEDNENFGATIEGLEKMDSYLN